MDWLLVIVFALPSITTLWICFAYKIIFKLFTHINGICNIVDEDIMQEMKKSKVTNIRFREIYVIDTGEYEELIRQHNQQKPFLP